MARRNAEDRIIIDTLRHLTTDGRSGPPMREREAVLQGLLDNAALRSHFHALLVRHLMHVGDERAGLQHSLDQMSALVDDLTQPPWIPAIHLATVDTPAGSHALVALGRERRVVAYGEHVTPDMLARGDEVYLASDRQVIMNRAASGVRRTGETAEVVGYTDDGCLVIRSRDVETVVTLGGRLEDEQLAEGERVIWDPEIAMALGRLPRQPSRRFLLEEVPDLPLTAVGGLERELARLLDVLTMPLVAPELAARYRLSGRVSVMLEGPSGVGKTLLTRIAAAETQRRSGQRCRIAVVPPAGWESSYVGETEANIRTLFETLRTEAREGLAILFLDEVDAVGRARGNHNGIHGDRFLTALLHELDGFEARGNVAIVAATNRKSLLDPALVERLSSVEIRVPRPSRTAARRILDIHLPPDLPYAQEREVLVDLILTRLYARNGSAVTLLRLRDGTERVVHAAELVSGRVLEQVCWNVRSFAAGREFQGDDPGVCVRDIEQATGDVLRQLATVLGPRNALLHLPDLPMDVDVIAAEPLAGRVARPTDYRPAA